ncbi:hypothetical protein F511_27634 [Dorcoceras hygrometricum]|uniref:Uncharacterized protein n=1 Tax=Dorcoceras hygrometricum TaxID=472368 RepID=A0A2Z7D6Z7_9LAMI|nr:hypothetical protein F511_27634 [Dorcoceras hygrometricum]
MQCNPITKLPVLQIFGLQYLDRHCPPSSDVLPLNLPALEGLTRSARTDSPRQDWPETIFRRHVAAAHLGCGGGGFMRRGGAALNALRDTASRGLTTIVAPESQSRTCPTNHDSIGYPRMSSSGESSTTMHRLLHASGSHPIPTPYDPNLLLAASCAEVLCKDLHKMPSRKRDRAAWQVVGESRAPESDEDVAHPNVPLHHRAGQAEAEVENLTDRLENIFSRRVDFQQMVYLEEFSRWKNSADRSLVYFQQLNLFRGEFLKGKSADSSIVYSNQQMDTVISRWLQYSFDSVDASLNRCNQ